LDGQWFEVRPDRTINESSPEVLNEMASFVASRLHIDPKSVESAPPVEPEEDLGDENADLVAPADG